MRHAITVTHIERDQFAVDIRGHRLLVDQPQQAHELEAGPAPVELWVAALAACVAHFAHRVLARVDPAATLVATCEYEMSDAAPWRVAFVHVVLTLPPLSAERMVSIRRAAEHCTVGRSLERPPEVVVTLRREPVATPAMTAVDGGGAPILSGAAAAPNGGGRREP